MGILEPSEAPDSKKAKCDGTKGSVDRTAGGYACHDSSGDSGAQCEDGGPLSGMSKEV